MRGIKRIIALAVLGLCVAAFAAMQWFERWQQKPLSIQEPIAIELQNGSSLRKFASELVELGVLDNARLFLLAARQRGTDRRLHAGEYLISPGLTGMDLLALLESGAVIHYPVTFVEGWTVSEVIAELRNHPLLNLKELPGNATELAGVLGVKDQYTSAEGLLFADTYSYRKGGSAIELLRRAYERLDKLLAQEWSARAGDLPYENAYQALIAASLVEKETGLASERGKIAGVFTRRLQQGMKLQTDPTVIYGLGESFDGNLTRKHLREPGPYNTYVNRGLPPSPIAVVGLESILAALHPEEGSALYFVARGDGSHAFSDTLAEHVDAVNRFQRNPVANYRSSPAKSDTGKTSE